MCDVSSLPPQPLLTFRKFPRDESHHFIWILGVCLAGSLVSIGFLRVSYGFPGGFPRGFRGFLKRFCELCQDFCPQSLEFGAGSGAGSGGLQSFYRTGQRPLSLIRLCKGYAMR